MSGVRPAQRPEMPEMPLVGRRLSVLNCLHRSHPGGAHWRVTWVAELLEREGIRTIPLFPAGGSDLFARHLDEDQTPYERLTIPALRRDLGSNLRFLASIPWTVAGIRRLIEKHDVDVVHVNGITNVQPVLAALRARRRVVWHLNDMQTPVWFVRTLRRLASSPDVCLALASEEILDHYGLRPLKDLDWMVMPAPIPPPRSWDGQPPSRAALGIPDDAFVLGFVGNLVPVKGPMDFIEIATRLMRGSDRDFHALIVGPGVDTQPDYPERLRTMVEESGLAGRFHFVGFQKDVKRWLELFDVHLFTSYSEACPIVMLEALDAGVPTVTTLVGDVPRMIEGLGTPTARPGDHQGFVRATLRLLERSPEEQRRNREAMQARVRSLYSLDHVARLHLDLYLSLAGGQRG